MRLEKAQYTARAYTTCIFVLLSRFLVVLFAAAAMSLAPSTTLLAQQPVQTGTQDRSTSKSLAGEGNSVRPFRVQVPQAALIDLRQRIASTRWPDQETVADRSQGVQLTIMKELVRYWGSDYDWRKAEAKLNALPQFVTTIDGVDIHFIHVRSKNSNALPLIITHGWPGSVFELIKVIGPLTDPTAYGGRAEEAFDVIIPSMPGYGFSGKPKVTGWGRTGLRVPGQC